MQEQMTNINDLSKKELKLFLRDQMIVDIDVVLAPYRNKDIGMRILANKTGISEKTLKRVTDHTTTPHQSTIERFYRHFFEMIEDNSSTEVHKQIKQEILRNSASPGATYNHSLEETLEENKVFREIFLYSRTGKITKRFVKEEFGKYGIEIVTLMLAENILIEEDRGIYSEGAMSVPKTLKAIKTIVEELVSENLDPEMLSEVGNNKAFYYLEGVSDDSKQDLLKIVDDYQVHIRDYMFNKAELGPHRVFIVGAMDELKRKVNTTPKDIQTLH
ncbi:MAG: hypothetical protein KAG61_04055 [Bacteriovoracaceae bacterium]|nr:hypothetical protein [Bacteriovoracaceae bacterium]